MRGQRVVSSVAFDSPSQRENTTVGIVARSSAQGKSFAFLEILFFKRFGFCYLSIKHMLWVFIRTG